MIDLLNIDCMEYMATCKDNQFDLAIVDPPYGWDTEIKGRRLNGGTPWNVAPESEYFNELFRVSNNQIIWGGNYFLDHLPPTKCFLIWDKKITDQHINAMSEFAWTSFDTVAKTFYSPTPGIRGFYDIDGKRIHPTQKPIRLYQWIMINYAKQGDKIIDTHGGSMSIACAVDDVNKIEKMDLSLVLCEIDKDYYDDGCKRFKEQTAQLTIL